MAVVAALAPVPIGPAGAANPSADLDQCKNGATGLPTCTWVNGNLGPNHSKYAEGDSVPFRIRFDNLAAGTHTVTIQWDTTKGGKHAYDYLTTYNHPPQTGAAPCSGSGCTTSSTVAIPLDTNVPPSATQDPGVFTMWRGTLTSTSAYTMTGSYASDNSTRISIDFTTSTDDDPILAWSGHVASELDWGPGTAASGISGSPYHMRLLDLDGARGGNQDRSLKVTLGAAPGSITIVKQAMPEGSRQFAFTSSDNGSFTLVDDGTAPNSTTFDNLTNFYTPSGLHSYDYTETVPPGWQVSSITCTGAGAYTTDTATATAKVKLEEGENVTCTFVNFAPAVTVTKTPQTRSVDEPGGNVTFDVLVTNDSPEAVTLTELTDSEFGDVADSSNTSVVSTTCAVSAALARSGGTYSCSFTAFVRGNATGADHENTITARIEDDEGNTATDTDNATVDIDDVLPSITVDKSASAATVRTGQSVTYAYEVTTSGPETLDNVAVVDDKCSPVGFTGGDTNGDDLLDPGETWTFTCTTALTGNTVNTVTATGDDDEGNTATHTDTATVDVIDPRIAIDKVADSKATNPGATVTYSYTVTNPGDQKLSDVVVVDDKCSPVTFKSGDTDGDDRLDTNETWTYTCAVVVGSGADTLTNIGTVTAEDPTGATVSADDTETVVIAVVKGEEIAREADLPPAVVGVTLPRTGAQLVTWALTGTALLLGGFGLVVAGRRRRLRFN